MREKKLEGFPIHKSEAEPSSGDAETESDGKGVWYPKELDRDIWGGFRARIACQAFGPGETPMCSLGTGNQSDRWRLSRGSRFSEFDIDSSVTQELHQFSPMKTPLPVSPDNRMRSGKWRWESNDLLGFVARPEHCADATRFLGGYSIALARFTPRTGTTMTDAGSIHHAYTAISFGATSLRIEGETSRALDGAVWLGREVFARETSHAGDCPHGRKVGKRLLSEQHRLVLPPIRGF